MPDGKTHKRIWKSFIPLTAIISFGFILIGWWYFAIFVFLGYLLHGFGITNDLDLVGINSDEAFWIRSVIFMPLLLMSTFYSRAIEKFGGHRGWISHGYIISSYIRLLYFGFPFILIFRHFFLDPLYIEFLAMGIGLSFADGLHTTADLISGEVKWGNKRFGGHNNHLLWVLEHWYGYSPKRKTLEKEL